MDCEKLRSDIERLRGEREILSAKFEEMNESGAGAASARKAAQELGAAEDEILENYLEDFAAKNPEIGGAGWQGEEKVIMPKPCTCTLPIGKDEFLAGCGNDLMFFRREYGDKWDCERLDMVATNFIKILSPKEGEILVMGDGCVTRYDREEDGTWVYHNRVIGGDATAELKQMTLVDEDTVLVNIAPENKPGIVEECERNAFDVWQHKETHNWENNPAIGVLRKGHYVTADVVHGATMLSEWKDGANQNAQFLDPKKYGAVKKVLVVNQDELLLVNNHGCWRATKKQGKWQPGPVVDYYTELKDAALLEDGRLIVGCEVPDFVAEDFAEDSSIYRNGELREYTKDENGEWRLMDYKTVDWIPREITASGKEVLITDSLGYSVHKFSFGLLEAEELKEALDGIIKKWDEDLPF